MACSGADDQPADTASSAGQGSGETEGAAGSGGSDGAGKSEPSESALRSCTRFCQVLAVMDHASPCTEGDLVVRGQLIPRGEAGAGGAPDAPSEPRELELDP